MKLFILFLISNYLVFGKINKNRAKMVRQKLCNVQTCTKCNRVLFSPIRLGYSLLTKKSCFLILSLKHCCKSILSEERAF